MKSIARKIISILVLLIGWYSLCNGVTSFVTTIASLVFMKDQISFWNIQFLNVIMDPILIIGLILVLTGTYVWGWKRYRIILGVILLSTGAYSITSTLLVLYAPPSKAEVYHVPTLIAGYLFFTMLSIMLGVLFIIRQRKLSQVNGVGNEHN